MSKQSRPAGFLTALGLLVLVSFPVAGVGSSEQLVFYSPDVTINLFGQIVRDHEIVEVDESGVHELLGLTELPESVAINAFHHATTNLYLYSLDTTVNLGGTVFRPSDVIAYSNGVHVLYFDGQAAGVPPGACINALTEDGADLLMSFDITVALPGGPYFDHDLVRWDESEFSLELDGAAAGIPHSLDINAVHKMPDGNLWLSFDAGGEIAGTVFTRADVLELDLDNGTWFMALDHAGTDSSWFGVDLEALGLGIFVPPFPVPLMTPLGIAILILLMAMITWRRAHLKFTNTRGCQS